ncbi:N-acetylmuramoyl-L-alanine amidase [Virgibacillus ainsalahensis]
MHFKRTTLCMFSIYVVLLFFSPPVLANEAVVNEDNLNIRSGPGTDYDQIGQAAAGDVYTIIQTRKDWVEIELDKEHSGWVTKEYITINSEDGVEEVNGQSITIQYDNTHLRSAPSTDSDIIHFAKKGEDYQIIGRKGEWAEIKQDDTTGFVLNKFVDKRKSKSSSDGGFTNKTIVIDAGHGGRDVGAIGATGVFEKDIAYLTARELEHELTMLGANVLLTRSEDEFISLGSRTSYGNHMDTDAFISIHYNSTPSLPDVTGIETYYYHDQHKTLAEYIQTELIKETEGQDRGITFGDYLVIRQTFKPAVLLELGFISNPEHEALLKTTTHQKKIVTGIINGLGKYFAND